MSEQTIHTLENLNARIRAIVEKETLDKPLWVGGVVSKVYTSDIGHVYFNLFDDFAVTFDASRCRNSTAALTFEFNILNHIF